MVQKFVSSLITRTLLDAALTCERVGPHGPGNRAPVQPRMR